MIDMIFRGSVKILGVISGDSRWNVGVYHTCMYVPTCTTSERKEMNQTLR